MFFSCVFSITFDPKTGNPKPVSSAYLLRQLKGLDETLELHAFQCIIAPYGWELFETGQDHYLLDMFSWQHLANNLIATSKCITFLKFTQILYHVILTIHTPMHEY